MGLSKRKQRKQTKITSEEITETVEAIHSFKDKQEKAAKVAAAGDSLFTTNTKKDGLKAKRDKLRADRFAAEKAEKTSMGEDKLIKRFAKRMERREEAGLAPIPKKIKPSNRKMDDGLDDLGDLGDIWGAPEEFMSKEFKAFKVFAKKDMVNVKPVVLPVGGQSYNPSIKDHKLLLKDVAVTEEVCVAKDLLSMKRVKPLTYGDIKIEITAKPEDAPESEEEVDSSDEEIDMDAPLGINEPVDRLNLKDQSKRNKDKMTREKLQKIKDETIAKRFNKDIERIDNLVKQAENEGKAVNKRILRKHKGIAEELSKQETTGLVVDPKKLGRFRYHQRKIEYQLDSELSGNLRQMRPLGNDLMLEDRFDSIYRRNLVEPDAPTQGQNRRQKKLKFKMVSKIGSVAEDLYKETQEKKLRNDRREKGQKEFVNQDVIML